MHNGYVKLWRKTLDSGLFHNHTILAVWMWCLIKATHRSMKVVVGATEVGLLPGEFIFGRNAAAEELFTTPRKIRTAMKFLKSTNRLTTKTTNKFSVVSITNWSTYQNLKDKSDQQSDQQIDQQVTSKRPASDHKQEVKEHKNTTIVFSSEFVRFYEAYPKHEAKSDAWKAWQALNGRRPSIETILEAIERQKSGRKWREGYIKAPASWLRKGCWDDEVIEELFNASPRN